MKNEIATKVFDMMESLSQGSARYARRVAFAAAIGLTALALDAGTGASAQSPGNPPGFGRAVAAQEANMQRLLDIDGVVGAGVGRDARGRAAVVVTTARDGVAGIPRSLDGVSVVIMVTGPIHANAAPDCAVDPSHPSCGGEKIDPTAKFARPVPTGVSIGNEAQCSSGTIGARVTDGVNVFALSNNHVLALENTAQVGADPAADDSPSDTILQPGRFDTNCVADTDPLGVLYDFRAINFALGLNVVDAALMLTDAGRLGNATPADGYGTPSSVTVAAFLGQPVQKYGRTTGQTRGTVIIVNWLGWVAYSNALALFERQIVVDSSRGAFMKAGDSGALLVTDDGGNNPVGLLFAGNSSGKHGFANPIDVVLGRFGVIVDGD